jgi:hypothetical protein
MLRQAFVFVLALGMLFGGIVAPASAATHAKATKANTTVAARQAAVAAAKKRHRHHRHHASAVPTAAVRANS